MRDDDVVIAGAGLMTAVGLSAAETAASVRAGTARFAESRWHDRHGEPLVVAQAPEDGLPGLDKSLEAEAALTSREIRMLRLGTMPLRECLKPLGGSALRPGLALALPDMETARPLDRRAFLARFARQTGGVFDVAASRSDAKGRAGGLIALSQARERIRSGAATVALAGGIETYLDPYVLATLDQAGRAKSGVNTDGFIPGEAAAFVLLARADAARALGLSAAVTVCAVATGYEAGHLFSPEPYRGEGLAGALRQLLQDGGAPQPLGEVYASMNGESHWAKEWGVAYLRNQAAFEPNHGMHHPADCWGEAGAACGSLLVALAAIGIAKGYRRSPALIYCSSDAGERAAASIARAGA